MTAPIVVGIDIGTTKVCTVVARVENDGRVRVLGVGIEPSAGVRKGTVVDINAATRAIGHSIDKAERSSGLEITSALAPMLHARGSASSIWANCPLVARSRRRTITSPHSPTQSPRPRPCNHKRPYEES